MEFNTQVMEDMQCVAQELETKVDSRDSLYAV